MADLDAIDPKRTALMVLDMHRDVVADDGASNSAARTRIVVLAACVVRARPRCPWRARSRTAR